MDTVLAIQRLTCGYGEKTILENISFDLQSSEVLAIVGPNGCGKSTLIKTIARFHPTISGDIIFNNQSLKNVPTWELKQRGLSCFMQSGMVLPSLRVNEHFELAFKNNSRLAAEAILSECLFYFPSLQHCMEKRAGNLSGGQRQMLSFAMLIAQKTNCWLLDEPTAGLSPEGVDAATSFLKTIKAQKKHAILLVEHNYPVAFELADRVAVIRDGQFTDGFTPLYFKKSDFLTKHVYN